MSKLSFKEVCDILSARVNSIELKSFFQAQLRKASDDIEAVSMSAEDFINHLDSAASVADIMPVKFETSYMQGVVMEDGTIWNPMIHRRTIPFTVLFRMFEMYFNRGCSNTDFNAYLQLTWPIVIGRRCQYVVFESDIATREKLFEGVKNLPLTQINDYLRVWYDENRDKIVGFPSVRQAIRYLCYPKSLNKVSRWYDSELYAIDALKNSIYTYRLGDRYYISGIRDNGTTPLLKVFEEVDEIPFEYLVYLYILEGLWGTITALRSNQEYLNRFFPVCKDAGEMYKKYRNSRAFDGCLSKMEIIETCINMYNDLFAYIESTASEYEAECRSYTRRFGYAPNTDICTQTISVEKQVPRMDGAFKVFDDTMRYIQYGTGSTRNRNYVLDVNAVSRDVNRASEYGFDGRPIASETGLLDYHCYEQLPFILRKQMNSSFGVFDRKEFETNSSYRDRGWRSPYYEDHDFNTDYCKVLPQNKPAEEPCKGAPCFTGCDLNELYEQLGREYGSMPVHVLQNPAEWSAWAEERDKKIEAKIHEIAEMDAALVRNSELSQKYCEEFRKQGQCPGYYSKCALRSLDLVEMYKSGRLVQHGFENLGQIKIDGVDREGNVLHKDTCEGSSGGSCSSDKGICSGSCDSCGGHTCGHNSDVGTGHTCSCGEGTCQGTCKGSCGNACSSGKGSCNCSHSSESVSSKLDDDSCGCGDLIAKLFADVSPDFAKHTIGAHKIIKTNPHRKHKYINFKDSRCSEARCHKDSRPSIKIRVIVRHFNDDNTDNR